MQQWVISDTKISQLIHSPKKYPIRSLCVLVPSYKHKTNEFHLQIRDGPRPSYVSTVSNSSNSLFLLPKSLEKKLLRWTHHFSQPSFCLCVTHSPKGSCWTLHQPRKNICSLHNSKPTTSTFEECNALGATRLWNHMIRPIYLHRHTTWCSNRKITHRIGLNKCTSNKTTTSSWQLLN